MRDGHIRHNGPRLVFGLVVIAIGVLFTLDKLGYVNAGEFSEYWPVILIAIGLGRLIQPRGTHGRGFGVVLIVVGLWFLLMNFDVIDYRVWDFWPVLLLLLGISIVWRAITGPSWEGRRQPLDEAPLEGPRADSAAATGSAEPVSDDTSIVNGFAFLGGVKRKSVSRAFRGGELTAIMGGIELDLRGASIQGEQAIIDTFSFWGGIDIKVPQDWTVVVNGTPILGGFSDKTARLGGDGSKVLVIKGTALMGGVEIKN
jgi:predicted membrane protein